MEVGDYVQIKSGGVGVVCILEGVPHRKAYVDVAPGADAGYVYFRMVNPKPYEHGNNIDTMPLNIYDVNNLEVITEDEYNKITTNMRRFNHE